MALQAVGSMILFPNLGQAIGTWTGTGAYGTLIIDAASEKAAMIFELPATGTIIGAEFRTGTVTTGSTVDMRLETVSLTDGYPTGTLYHANATGTAILATTTDQNKIINDGFGAGTAWGSFTGTRKDKVAMVIAQPAAASGACQVAGVRPTTPAVNAANGFPYSALFTTAWAQQSVWPSLALEYSGGVYHYIHDIFFPFKNPASVLWNNGSAVAEYGGKITVPMSCRSSGIRASLDFDGTSDIVISLYNAAGTEIATTGTEDTNLVRTEGGGSGGVFCTYLWQTPVEISAGSDVYVGVKPQSTVNIELDFEVVETAAHAAAHPSGGKIIRVERATQGSGAWTETNTSIPRMALLIDQLNDGVGGAGGGGIRLAGPGGLAG